jgi:chemotaxis protein CheY-P-specific phosphatase CheC
MLTRARIEFTGPFSGRFSLLIPADMVGGIAANFLGMEENELVKVNKDDTIKEALNMVSGYTLSQMENAEDFQLGIPEILPGKESDTELLNDSQGKVLFIETEKQRLALVIQLD